MIYSNHPSSSSTHLSFWTTKQSLVTLSGILVHIERVSDMKTPKPDWFANKLAVILIVIDITPQTWKTKVIVFRGLEITLIQIFDTCHQCVSYGKHLHPRQYILPVSLSSSKRYESTLHITIIQIFSIYKSEYDVNKVIRLCLLHFSSFPSSIFCFQIREIYK